MFYLGKKYLQNGNADLYYVFGIICTRKLEAWHVGQKEIGTCVLIRRFAAALQPDNNWKVGALCVPFVPCPACDQARPREWQSLKVQVSLLNHQSLPRAAQRIRSVPEVQSVRRLCDSHALSSVFQLPISAAAPQHRLVIEPT